MILLRIGVGVLLVFCGTFIAYGLVSAEHGASAFDPLSSAVPLLPRVTTAVAMLLGIVANSLWERLAQQPPHERVPWTVFRDVLGSASLLRAALVSPIVFIVVYALVKNEPDLLVAHLLAFQNGFFWESVLKARRP